jgi:hypothetical protein
MPRSVLNKRCHPALPSVNAVDDFLEVALTPRRRWVAPFITAVAWQSLSIVAINGSLKTAVGSFRNRLRRLISASHDNDHRPHFRSPPAVTTSPASLLGTLAEAQNAKLAARAASFAATKTFQHLLSLKRSSESGISVHGLYVHQ